MLRKLKSEVGAKWQIAMAMAASLLVSMGVESDAKTARRKMAMDNRAQLGGTNRVTNLVVGLTVGGLLAAFLLPIAIDQIASVDTTSWTSGAAALWGILPVMVVLAIFLYFTRMAT